MCLASLIDLEGPCLDALFLPLPWHRAQISGVIPEPGIMPHLRQR